MKRFQFVVSLGLFSLAIASPVRQKPIVYKDNAKKPQMIIQGNEGFFVPGESFELSGNVQIRRFSTSGGSTVETLMTCAKASGNLIKIKDKLEVDKVRMTGGIRFTQSGEVSSTTATGDSADYDLKGEMREVNINGEVKISFDGNSTKGADKVNSTMTTSSRSATLVYKTKLTEKKTQVAELQSALVRGPIVFNGTQLVKSPTGEKLQKVFAKADKMTYAIAGESGLREVRLEGDLEFREIDAADDGAQVEGASLLILQLNEKNEIVKLRFKSEPGQQVKTTITKADTKGKKGGA